MQENRLARGRLVEKCARLLVNLYIVFFLGMTFLQAQLLVKFLDGDVFLIRVVIVDSRSFQLFQILLT